MYVDLLKNFRNVLADNYKRTASLLKIIKDRKVLLDPEEGGFNKLDVKPDEDEVDEDVECVDEIESKFLEKTDDGSGSGVTIDSVLNKKKDSGDSEVVEKESQVSSENKLLRMENQRLRRDLIDVNQRHDEVLREKEGELRKRVDDFKELLGEYREKTRVLLDEKKLLNKQIQDLKKEVVDLKRSQETIEIVEVDYNELKLDEALVEPVKYLRDPPVSPKKFKGVDEEYTRFNNYALGRINTKINDYHTFEAPHKESMIHEEYANFRDCVANMDYGGACDIASEYWKKSMIAGNKLKDLMFMLYNYSNQCKKYTGFYQSVSRDMMDAWLAESNGRDSDAGGLVDDPDRVLDKQCEVDEFDSRVEEEDVQHGFK